MVMLVEGHIAHQILSPGKDLYVSALEAIDSPTEYVLGAVTTCHGARHDLQHA